MILYALACDNGHEFESWFGSSASFDEQVARHLVQCPACGSARVTKRIMAPAIGRKGRPAAPDPAPEAQAPQPPAVPAPASEAPAPAALLSEREQAVRAMLRAVREHVVKNSDYVGQGFADEARRMHYGETEHRSIYGEADAAETKALIEEGIEVHPLPIVPDERN